MSCVTVNVPKRAGAFGVHATLGNHLAVEVRELLDQPDVLQERRSSAAGRLDVEVVADGCSGRMG